MDRITATRVFVTIAQLGSLTRAADSLDMSRAMVTRHLQAMEDWVGVRLFHRNTRRLSLTPAGERTLACSRDLLGLAEQLPLASEDRSAPLRGLLRVACAPALAHTALTQAVVGFLARHPEVAVDLVIGEKTVNLVEERIDLSVRITNALDPGLIARPLGQCRSVICAAPAYLQRHGTPARMDDLSLHNCLTFAYFGKSLWHLQEGDAPAQAVPVSGNLSANDSTTLLRATLAGVGISLQPVFVVAEALARGELVALLPQARPRSLGIHAIYSSRDHQPLLQRAFLDHLLQDFALRPELQ